MAIWQLSSVVHVCSEYLYLLKAKRRPHFPSKKCQYPPLLHILWIYFSWGYCSTGTQNSSISHNPGIFAHKLDISLSIFHVHLYFPQYQHWHLMTAFSVFLSLFHLLWFFKLTIFSEPAIVLILSLDNSAALEI